jgi:uncharacterized Rmd1/YagE family protein
LRCVSDGRTLNIMVHPIAKSGKTEFKARALLVGERIDLRSLAAVERLAADPVVLAAGTCGIAVLFRYGAVVLFDVAPLEEGELLRQLLPLVTQPYLTPETESLSIRIDPNSREGMEGNLLYLADSALERFQLVADILSKSTVLAMYEAKVSRSFDLIEPFARDLERNSRIGRTAGELLQQIGGALLSEHNLVGRVEVVDKPEIIWDHPDLERLYVRLEDEFEIRERHLALERKLDLVSRTAQTVLELLQNRRTLRLEWYVVVLILVEIVLSVYQIFFSGGH